MLKNKAPYDAEVDAEVAKEYQRIQDEKRRSRPDPAIAMEAMRTRVTDLEGSVKSLGEDVAASHKRMEDMMRLILQNQSQKFPPAIDDTTEPSSSARMHDTSALTSTTVELTMLAQNQAPTTGLSALGGADVFVVPGVHVPSDVAEDAATFVVTDGEGVQPSSETVIASIIEDILEEGRKPKETPAGDEHLEPVNSEVAVVTTEDVEEGQLETSGNADVPEEIVSLEQVTMSKTHEYQTYRKPSHHCLFVLFLDVFALACCSSCHLRC